MVTYVLKEKNVKMINKFKGCSRNGMDKKKRIEKEVGIRIDK